MSKGVVFSLGSALAATILAGNIGAGGGRVAERGYVIALWAGAAICAISACGSSLLSSRWSGRTPNAAAPGDRVAVDDAELAAAGLVGVEARED